MNPDLNERFRELDDPTFWVDKIKATLEKIDFERLGLTLIQKDEKLLLQENLHYYLSESPEGAPFNELFGAYWFRHLEKEGTYKVIFAYKEKTNTQGSFDPAHVKNYKVKYKHIKSNAMSITSFQYQYSKENGEFKSNSPQAALYLSYLFMVKRDYLQANKYLEQAYKHRLRSTSTKATNGKLTKVYELFTEYDEDNAPNAVALCLKTYCLFSTFKEIKKYRETNQISPKPLVEIYFSSKRNIYGDLKLSREMEEPLREEFYDRSKQSSPTPKAPFSLTFTFMDMPTISTPKLIKDLTLLCDLSEGIKPQKLALLYKHLMQRPKGIENFSLYYIDYIYFLSATDPKVGLRVLPALRKLLAEYPVYSTQHTIKRLELLSKICSAHSKAYNNKKPIDQRIHYAQGSGACRLNEPVLKEMIYHYFSDCPDIANKMLPCASNNVSRHRGGYTESLSLPAPAIMEPTPKQKMTLQAALPLTLAITDYPEELKSLQHNCTTLESFILKLMNKPPQEHEELVHFQVPRVALGTPDPELKTILFYASLKKGEGLLKNLNPNLTGEEINQVIHASHLFMLDHLECKRFEQLIELDRKYSELGFAATQEAPPEEKKSKS